MGTKEPRFANPWDEQPAPPAAPAAAPVKRAARAPAKARRRGSAARSESDETKGPRVARLFYLNPEDLDALELERLDRVRGGRRRRGSDLSALVREAIQAAYGKRVRS